MAHLIDKAAVVAEINRVLNSYDPNEITSGRYALVDLRNFLDTLEVVKEVDLKKESLTWEDIRELYILFAEVDAEIEFCKCDIQTETIGYYQEVLKRFKAQKGE